MLAALQIEPVEMGATLPGRAHLAAFLKTEGYTRHYQQRSLLRQLPRCGAVSPHDGWQLDGQGVTLFADVGTVMLINAVDVIRRVKDVGYPRVGSTNFPAED